MRAASIRQILDVSEELFSNYGYPGVTIKDVAEKVGVDPALVLYYFDGKQALFDAVCERRMQDALASRHKALDAYEAQAGDHPTVDGALKAYYDGAFDAYIEGGEGWRNFGRIFAQINNAPGYGAEKMLFWDPVVLRLINILQKALPGLDREEIFWGFQFTSAAFTQALSRTGRIDRLSGGACSSEDLTSVRERMSVFMAAGFEALRSRMAEIQSQSGKESPPRRRRTKLLQSSGRA